MRQTISSEEGSLAYCGGTCLQRDDEVQRCQALAERVVQALPSSVGYIGIDMILGEAKGGSEDVVLEVNPRITTSYVALRNLATDNLANAMIQIAVGTSPVVTFADNYLAFSADGSVFGGE